MKFGEYEWGKVEMSFLEFVGGMCMSETGKRWYVCIILNMEMGELIELI
jgi:hypothetical protein